MKNVGRSLLIKCTKRAKLSPKLDSGPCFILIGLVLECLNETEEEEKKMEWMDWCLSPWLSASRTDFEITEDDETWPLTHNLPISYLKMPSTFQMSMYAL